MCSATFIELALSGCFLDPEKEIDEYISKWHESDNSQELHEWLGMTWDEYSRFMKCPRSLRAILMEREIQSRLGLSSEIV